LVINMRKDIGKASAKQGVEAVNSDPNKIGASTQYDFEAKNLTAYGGLLPVATMLERLGFQQLVEETLTVKRLTRAMSMYQFVLAMVLAAYVGFSRLYQLRFVAREPMLTGIVKVLRLPPQCTFWRFLASLHLGIAQQLLSVQRRMRARVAGGEGWGKSQRFIALRYKKKPQPPAADQPEQYQLFDTPEYSYRVFVTNMRRAIDLLVWFYDQRAGAENLIKEANNDAGLAAYPSGRWLMNCNHFQLSMLAYNLNCWLMLFNREEGAQTATLRHTTLATARLRFLFLAAKIWRHAGRVGVSYSDHYAEQRIFRRLMDRLRAIAADHQPIHPVLATALRE
jgi:hypothetical protein